MKKLSTTSMRLLQSKRIAQPEHNLQWYHGENNTLATENAELKHLYEFQLQVVVHIAKQHGELTSARPESAVAFLTEKIALRERAQAAEATLVFCVRRVPHLKCGRTWRQQ
jgi:hypothetical protein